MPHDHPSDEELSAHLDGDAPDLAAHIDGCAVCRARVADLRVVISLVAAPPSPPDDATREVAVAAALRSRATPAPKRLALFAAAAAVVVALGVATPLLLRHDQPKQTATALSGKTSSGASAGAGTSADRSADALATVDGGDIGDQSDPAVVGGLVSKAAVPPLAPAPDKGADTGPPSGLAATATAAPFVCTPPAGGGQVVYRARLRWQGVAAEVFAIEPGRRMVIMDRARCQVLVDRSF
jgi:hypothetical protein